MSEETKPGSPQDERKERAADQGQQGGASATKPAEGGDEAPEGTSDSPRA